MSQAFTQSSHFFSSCEQAALSDDEEENEVWSLGPHRALLGEKPAQHCRRGYDSTGKHVQDYPKYAQITQHVTESVVKAVL